MAEFSIRQTFKDDYIHTRPGTGDGGSKSGRPSANDRHVAFGYIRRRRFDHDLRSTDAVRGYCIQATDGEIGHVEDFIIDDETWAIRYLVVDTRNWWPGKKVLLSPQWIESVSWPESKVFVNLSREAIKQSPEYTEESLLTRDYETQLHRHYDRQGYWVDEPASKEHSR